MMKYLEMNIKSKTNGVLSAFRRLSLPSFALLARLHKSAYWGCLFLGMQAFEILPFAPPVSSQPAYRITDT